MCDRCGCVFVAPCIVDSICVMFCKECSLMYGAEICNEVIDMSWAKAVSDWNKGQIWRDDLYGIPKKGGEYYADVKEMMDDSKHKKDVEKMMGKEPAKESMKEPEKESKKESAKKIKFTSYDQLKPGMKIIVNKLLKIENGKPIKENVDYIVAKITDKNIFLTREGWNKTNIRLEKKSNPEFSTIKYIIEEPAKEPEKQLYPEGHKKDFIEGLNQLESIKDKSIKVTPEHYDVDMPVEGDWFWFEEAYNDYGDVEITKLLKMYRPSRIDMESAIVEKGKVLKSSAHRVWDIDVFRISNDTNADGIRTLTCKLLRAELRRDSSGHYSIGAKKILSKLGTSVNESNMVSKYNELNEYFA